MRMKPIYAAAILLPLVCRAAADIPATPKLSPYSSARLSRPWAIVVLDDGSRLVRDSTLKQIVLQHANGRIAGCVGPRATNFEGTYDLARDSRGRILVAKRGTEADPRSGFCVLHADLTPALERLMPEGDGPDQVSGPMGIAANSAGHIFLSDTSNNRVQEFTETGEFVRSIGVGDLRLPMKVAFDSKNRLYVADSGHNRVCIYEPQPDGTYKLLKPLSGKIKEPCYVLVDDAGRVFVSTNRVAGIYMYDPDGTLKWTYFGEPGRPLSCPRGLALDGKGNLLVVDEAQGKVLTAKVP